MHKEKRERIKRTTLRDVQEQEHFYIPLSDGTRLAVRAWMPVDAVAQPVPAILEYLPYRKRDLSAARDETNHPWMAARDYACVRVDIRGSGESDVLLEDEYTAQELADGVEVIDWLSRQNWCDGMVGMMGISWGGFNALQIAALRPPALKAIITVCSTDDRYADDIHFAGGCLLTDNLTWSAQMTGYLSLPPDPALRDDWREVWLMRLENMPFLAANWTRHLTRDEFWKHGSVCEDFSAIECAVFAVGGWYDLYTNAISRLLAGLNSPCLGLIGPWVHKYPHLAYPEPAMDFLPEMQRFWDCWLKGQDTGIMEEPKLRAYIHDPVAPWSDYNSMPGRFIGEMEWPPKNVQPKTLFLNASGLESNPVISAPISISSPQDTGLAAGRACPGMRLGMEHPTDQRIDDAGSLCFDSGVLTEAVEILGTPKLKLSFTVDQPQAQLAVRLCDVRPDGSVFRVSYGLLNLNLDVEFEHHQLLEPGKIYCTNIKLNDIGYRFMPGHQIRIAISTAYWPICWPVGSNMLSVSPGKSELHLPIRATQGDCIHLGSPLSESPDPGDTGTEHRPATYSRVIIQDVATGQTTLKTREDFGCQIVNSSSITTSSRVTEIYSINRDDPLSAWLVIEWIYQHGRKGQFEMQTIVRHSQWQDQENYHLQAELIAYDNDEEIFHHTWQETLLR